MILLAAIRAHLRLTHIICIQLLIRPCALPNANFNLLFSYSSATKRRAEWYSTVWSYLVLMTKKITRRVEEGDYGGKDK